MESDQLTIVDGCTIYSCRSIPTLCNYGKGRVRVLHMDSLQVQPLSVSKEDRIGHERDSIVRRLWSRRCRPRPPEATNLSWMSSATPSHSSSLLSKTPSGAVRRPYIMPAPQIQTRPLAKAATHIPNKPARSPLPQRARSPSMPTQSRDRCPRPQTPQPGHPRTQSARASSADPGKAEPAGSKVLPRRPCARTCRSRPRCIAGAGRGPDGCVPRRSG